MSTKGYVSTKMGVVIKVIDILSESVCYTIIICDLLYEKWPLGIFHHIEFSAWMDSPIFVEQKVVRVSRENINHKLSYDCFFFIYLGSLFQFPEKANN